MNTACATFSVTPDQTNINRQLFICTAFSAGVGARSLNQVFDNPPALWKHAFGARVMMEQAINNALATTQQYPQATGVTMYNSLNWNSGLDHLLSTQPSTIKITLNYETCHLLPEMAPVPLNNPTSWLDTIAPIYRTLEHVEQFPVSRCTEKSLAIIYQQDEEVFFQLTENLQRELDSDELIVDIFAGSEFVGDSQYASLCKVFHEHRAVLFLGHLHREPDDTKNGWQITQNDCLRMLELKGFLGVGRQGHYTRNPTPEIVFAGCCYGAGQQLDTSGQAKLWYPKLFLDAGVRFFIGSWMDVVLRRENLGILQTLIEKFFQKWVKTPDNAVEHLYNAKQACDFHLLTSLYQIYSAGGEQAIVSGGRQPLGALVSGLAEGDQVGNYVLSSEIWAERYARTFQANDVSTRKSHLVQVLADEWQDSPTLANELRAAIKKLKDASLGVGHLIPSRHEFAMLSRQAQDQRKLHILVYDRDDATEAWCPLTSKEFDRNNVSEHLMRVLWLGSQISVILAELHAKKIQHGNLDPGNVLFRTVNGIEHVVIKDAWVSNTRPGRCTQPQYTAPEERTHEEGIDSLKYDCWGLGIILFELATGQAPFGEEDSPEQGLQCSLSEIMGIAQGIPEALDRVVRECLVPSAKVRPSAELVAKRLLLALHAGGNYVGDFEEILNTHIQAGQRLFAVVIDEFEPLEEALNALASQGYSFLVVAEDRGLFDYRTNQTLVPWIEANELFQVMSAQAAQNNSQPPRFPTPTEVSAFNAEILLGQVGGIPRQRPIVLIRGHGWWDYGSAAWRILKTLQYNPQHSPIIIIADNFVGLQEDLARSFVGLTFPPPTPALLFEQILSFASTEGLSIPNVSAEMAVQLAPQLFPCSMRELTEALRVCVLTHGVIDERVLEIRDERREQQFMMLGTATYTPISKLPEPRFVGLPQDIKAKIESWAENTLLFAQQPMVWSVPKRVMISAPSGCGKTVLAHSLAARVHYPLVQIDATQCLRGGVGESEEALRQTLAAAGSLSRCIILLDNVDKFFAEDQQQGGGIASLTATMTRMSSILLNWLDAIPLGIVVVMTANDPAFLPIQWRRRIELPLPLNAPTGDVAYRSAVFTAIFQKFGLDGLAQDNGLMQNLATQTDPTIRIQPLLSPFARRVSQMHTIELETAADIENWVHETILLHHFKSPETQEFWSQAI